MREEERDIVYLPCSQNKNPVGVWKSRHFTCKLLCTFNATLCSKMKENSRIKKFVFLAGLPDNSLQHLMYSRVRVSSLHVFLVSFSEGEMGSVIRLQEGIVSLRSHIFPLQWD